MSYRHLSQVERDIIAVGATLEKSSREIAWIISRHHSTVCRELERNVENQRLGYSTYRAEILYEERRKKGGPKRKICSALRRFVVNRLKQQWSPEQIVGRARLEGRTTVSVETIYRFLYRDRAQGGSLWKNLRRCRPRRRRRFPRYTWRRERPNLEARPAAANRRTRSGHWERDLIEGNERQGSVLTLVDRKTRYVRLAHLKRKWASYTHEATLKALRGLRVTSLTNDNGPEFSAFQKTATELRARIFFTRPYAAWERGTVENTNGLIRQYFPKKTSLKEVSRERLEFVERRLNERPRKTLGYLTPAEVHFKKHP